MTELTCFKAYDVRGEIGVNIDEAIAYRIGRAVAQHFSAKSVVIGFDARETSHSFSAAAARGVIDAGANVFNIGMAGTEEMYWAVTEFGACAGIEVTASHNPINYNGMKFVKSHSRPLDDAADFQVIKSLASSQEWVDVAAMGRRFEHAGEAREAYVNRVLSFVDVKALRPLKIVVNSGNGAAGPTFDAIAKRLQNLGAPLKFIRVHHTPDATFPNGIPNPLLPENHSATAEVVKAEKADLGLAFDGDFDALISSKLDAPVFTTRLSETVTVHNLNRAFNALLAELNLKTGADGRTRTLYSFRHFYATLNLERGVTTHALSRQLGNSTEMIDRHYSKYSPLLNAEVHSGRKS